MAPSLSKKIIIDFEKSGKCHLYNGLWTLIEKWHLRWVKKSSLTSKNRESGTCITANDLGPKNGTFSENKSYHRLRNIGKVPREYKGEWPLIEIWHLRWVKKKRHHLHRNIGKAARGYNGQWPLIEIWHHRCVIKGSSSTSKNRESATCIMVYEHWSKNGTFVE